MGQLTAGFDTNGSPLAMDKLNLRSGYVKKKVGPAGY